jgi:hypothetical protein
MNLSVGTKVPLPHVWLFMQPCHCSCGFIVLPAFTWRLINKSVQNLLLCNPSFQGQAHVLAPPCAPVASSDSSAMACVTQHCMPLFVSLSPLITKILQSSSMSVHALASTFNIIIRDNVELNWARKQTNRTTLSLWNYESIYAVYKILNILYVSSPSCVTFLSLCFSVLEILRQSTYREKGFILAHSFGVCSP